MDKLYITFLLISVSACSGFTERKALKILYKEIGSAPMPRRSFEKHQYPNGSVGYAYATMGGEKPYIFDDTLYILERSHRFQGNRRQVCMPLPSFEQYIGYHKAGKCEGRWYTYTEYSVKLADSCRKKFLLLTFSC